MTDGRKTKGNLKDAFECLEAGGNAWYGMGELCVSGGRLEWRDDDTPFPARHSDLTEDVFTLVWPKVKRWKWAYQDGLSNIYLTTRCYNEKEFKDHCPYATHYTKLEWTCVEE